MIAGGFLLVLYLGGIAGLFAIATARFWFVLSRLRIQVPKSIAELDGGKSSFVVGQLLTPQQSLIRSPYSDTMCAGFVASVQQKLRHFDPKQGFLASEWTQVGTSVRTSPFLVKDDTGVICVIATRAHLSLSRTVCGELDVKHDFHPVQSGMRWFAQKFAPKQTLWVNECLLCDGDAVFVSGTAQPATTLDKQFVPSQFHSAIKYVIKGNDVVISTTVPASHIPFYEKCLWFCSLTSLVCIALLLAILLLF